MWDCELLVEEILFWDADSRTAWIQCPGRCASPPAPTNKWNIWNILSTFMVNMYQKQLRMNFCRCKQVGKSAKKMCSNYTWIRDIWKLPTVLHFSFKVKSSNCALPAKLFPEISGTPVAEISCRRTVSDLTSL